MIDRELLELAAKAAGIEGHWHDGVDDFLAVVKPPPHNRRLKDFELWNPIIDDGDALRLAVKLNLHITIHGYEKRYLASRDFTMHRGYLIHAEELGDDPYAATRRAIVRAAAEIGRAMA